MSHTSSNEAQTRAVAKDFASTLTGGDIVALHGDLGAGKTTFVKGLADALGTDEDITSPTFTLLNVYPLQNKKSGITTLVHIDTYRLHNAQELQEIGVEDYLGDPETVCVIEWPEKITDLLKEKKIKHIYFEHASENERNIRLED